MVAGVVGNGGADAERPEPRELFVRWLRTQAAAEANRPPGAPRGYRERRVAACFAEVLGLDETAVTRDTDFFAVGGDPTSAHELLEVMAEDSGVRLPDGAVEESRTVRGLAGRIADSHPTRSGRIVGFGTELPGRPLFCMMAAFQGREIARRFNAIAGRPLYVLQQSGLEGRARVDRGARKRARHAIEDLRSVQPSGPYLLAGYSFDSYVALEMTRLLLAEGEQVDLLAIIDIGAPLASKHRKLLNRMKTRWWTVCERHPQQGLHYSLFRGALFVRANVREGAERFKWWSLTWTAGLWQRPTTVQSRLMYELTRGGDRSYQPEPVDTDVVVLKADDFKDTDLRRTEPDLSWSRIVTGEVEVVELHGDHVTILEGEDAEGVAKALAAAVAEREPDTGGR